MKNLFTVLSGRKVLSLPEDPGKVFGIGEADRMGNVNNTDVRIFQHFFCLPEPQFVYIIQHSGTKLLLKGRG